MAIRCLLLLNELLTVCLPPAGAGQLTAAELLPGQRRRQLLADWLVAALTGIAADELASYASLAAGAALWGQQQQQQVPGQQHEQPDDATPAARRAQLVLGCVCGALRLLAWHQQQQGSCQAAGPAGERLAGSCLEVLQSFRAATSQAGWLEPLHREGQPGAAGWQLAAARLLPLADCCVALAAAAEAGWLQGRAPAGAVAEAANASLDAVLQLQVLAAQVAAAQQQGKESKASGANSNASGSPAALAAYCHRLCWKAADALLQLLGGLHRGGQKVQHHGQAWQHQHAGHAPHAAPLDTYRQRWEGQQAAVLADALDSLQRSSAVPALASDARGLLLQLRCCRVALQAALAQPRVGQLVAAHRQGAGGAAAAGVAGAAAAAAAPAAASQPSMLLAAWVCEVVWGAYEGGQGKQLCGAGPALPCILSPPSLCACSLYMLTPSPAVPHPHVTGQLATAEKWPAKELQAEMTVNDLTIPVPRACCAGCPSLPCRATLCLVQPQRWPPSDGVRASQLRSCPPACTPGSLSQPAAGGAGKPVCTLSSSRSWQTCHFPHCLTRMSLALLSSVPFPSLPCCPRVLPRLQCCAPCAGQPPAPAAGQAAGTWGKELAHHEHRVSAGVCVFCGGEGRRVWEGVRLGAKRWRSTVPCLV